MTTTLVLGGVRSGKSRYAASLMPDADPVVVITPGSTPTGDDPAWTKRVRAHQAARPHAWHTEETTDVTRAILRSRHPVIVDCLGTWVTAVIDEAHAWEDEDKATELVETASQELAALWANAPFDCVAVSNEVGLSVVPATAPGRLFQDLLGRVNARISAVSERTVLAVAGRAVDISDAPLIG